MSKTKSTASKTTASAKDRPRGPVPWIEGDIDYGPMRVALGELATWAFDLADKSVVDWPEGRRRVKSVRRAVAASIRGRRVRVSDEDLAFTASLLIRIFDADLGLGFGHMITVLSELGLPTVDVPRPTRPRAVPVAPSSIASVTPHIPTPHVGVRLVALPSAPRSTAVGVMTPCPDCPGYRVAA